MTKRKFNPCPFCGGNHIHLEKYDFNETQKAWKAVCNNCWFELGRFDTCDYAHERWNTRPIESALQARIAELEKAAVVWHKYPEEKPGLCNTYLVMIDGDNQPTIMFWNKTDWLFDDEMCYKIEITHWAYLPAPPEEGE